VKKTTHDCFTGVKKDDEDEKSTCGTGAAQVVASLKKSVDVAKFGPG
jgi:hypothetical protein